MYRRHITGVQYYSNIVLPGVAGVPGMTGPSGTEGPRGRAGQTGESTSL